MSGHRKIILTSRSSRRARALRLPIDRLHHRQRHQRRQRRALVVADDPGRREPQGGRAGDRLRRFERRLARPDDREARPWRQGAGEGHDRRLHRFECGLLDPRRRVGRRRDGSRYRNPGRRSAGRRQTSAPGWWGSLLDLASQVVSSDKTSAVAVSAPGGVRITAGELRSAIAALKTLDVGSLETAVAAQLVNVADDETAANEALVGRGDIRSPSRDARGPRQGRRSRRAARPSPIGAPIPS